MSDYPSKEQLDQMDKPEVQNVRHNILSKKSYNENGTDKQYVSEVEFYMNTRFKQDKIDQFNRWGEQAKKEPNGPESVVGDLINKNGVEWYYKWYMETKLEEIGEFQYIKVNR